MRKKKEKLVSRLKKVVELLVALILIYHGLKYLIEQAIAFFEIDDAVYTDNHQPIFLPNSRLAIIAVINVTFTLFVVIISNIMVGNYFRRMKRMKDVYITRTYKALSLGLNGITISWFLLYTWLFIFWCGFNIPNTNRLYSLVWTGADIFHAVTAFFFCYCYLILEYPKSDKTTLFLTNKAFSNKLLVSISITLLCLTFSIMGRYFRNDFDKIGPMMLSFWVGLSMQFLFGRLNDRKLQLDGFLIVPLYVYVLLQITWAALANIISDGGLLIIYVSALLLKIYFYFFIIMLVTKHQSRFENYISGGIHNGEKDV